jgi:hypothetical protein
MANPRSTVFKAGMEEGRQQVRKSTIQFLEDRLVNDKENRPDRGTPEYKFAMDLIRDTVKHIETAELA